MFPLTVLTTSSSLIPHLFSIRLLDFLSSRVLLFIFRLTGIEEDLLDLAHSLGSQQMLVEQLELELEDEQEGVRKGQR